ncbi:hypothetical protein HPB47_015409 [Ixodes persulcatus]|uniref:Uncharacterized protein n=1 Tax=Ixodes persulcatus TaxID=34615 RepID=A0AC60QTK8_IXOPE|nr:hypothetical protein HPB47_015409 [Ixodes persulcatus]
MEPDITPEMVLKSTKATGSEALTCRRVCDRTTQVTTYLGKRVTYYIEFSGLLKRCFLYKRTVPHC